MEAKTDTPTKVGILLVETSSVDIARFVAREIGWVEAGVMPFDHIRHELRIHLDVNVKDVTTSDGRLLIDHHIPTLRQTLVQKGLSIAFACTSHEIHGPFYCRTLTGQAETILKVHHDLSVAVVKLRAADADSKKLVTKLRKRNLQRQEFSRVLAALDAAGKRMHLTGETRGIIIQAWLNQNVN